MALNLYAFRDDVKARAGLSDTDDDSILDMVLPSVSRQIDAWCGRPFFTVLGTRYFTAERPGDLFVPDLVSVSALKTDTAADRTYATTWAATDFDLEPFNAAEDSPPGPYWRIRRVPGGDYGLLTSQRGVSITGRWGYYDVLQTSTATLAEDLDTSELGVDVSSGPAFKAGQVIEIDSERMEISAIVTNTLTVERGINGTTAAVHSSAAAIRVVTFPVIGEAALQQAVLEFRVSTSAPLGVQGSAEFGPTIRAVGLHPFVRNMLQPFRVPAIG